MLHIVSDTALETLLDQAHEATAPPPEPEEMLRQWVPGWIRWPLRLLFLPFVLIDLTMQKVARKIVRPPFKQTGSCLKRGNCCHYILLPHATGLFGKLFFFWSTQILGFYPRSREIHESEGKKVLVMGCRYLKSDGRCRHYRLRPMVCRKWPLIAYFGHPRLLKGCGFKAVRRD